MSADAGTDSNRSNSEVDDTPKKAQEGIPGFSRKRVTHLVPSDRDDPELEALVREIIERVADIARRFAACAGMESLSFW
jgi:hypothetical protein